MKYESPFLYSSYGRKRGVSNSALCVNSRYNFRNSGPTLHSVLISDLNNIADEKILGPQMIGQLHFLPISHRHAERVASYILRPKE